MEQPCFCTKSNLVFHGAMTPRRNILHWFPSTLTIFILCSPPFNLIDSVWHTVHLQTPWTVRYHSILYQTSIFFFPVLVFHFYLLLFPLSFHTFSFFLFFSTFADYGKRFHRSSCIRYRVRIEEYIASPLYGCIKNPPIFVHTSTFADSMSSSSSNWSCLPTPFLHKYFRWEEVQGKLTFDTFDAEYVCNLRWSQFLEDGYRTGAVDTASISCCFNVGGEKLSRARVHLDLFLRRTEFCGTHR